jgi:signal transduction histidine kinase
MIREQIENSGTPVKLLIGYVLLILIALIDYLTADISFSIFYLIPVSFVTWFVNKKFGTITSVMCALMWFYIESLTSGHINHFSMPIPYWNAAVRFGFFIIVVFLISKIRALQDNLEATIEQRTLALQKEIEENKAAQNKILHQSSQLSQLYKKLESIREEQNQRIAREIHDELGQSLTGVNLEVMWIAKKHASNPDLLERMQVISEIVTGTITTIRKISNDLRPRLLDQLGLIAAIEAMVKEVQKRTAVKLSLVFPEENIIFDNHTSNTIYRIVQEAVTNILRHSGAVEARIIIEKDRLNTLHLKIADNGVGFNLENAEKGNSLGLIGMRERAKTINSTLKITTSLNTGTEIRLSVPLEQKQNGKHTDS